ncbi:MAG: hypothetical protein BRC25_01260, partial [Parcubacteria group bacterium SW_6_46_9]
EEAVRKIVDIRVDEVLERLEKKDLTLVLEEPVYEYLAEEGYDPQYGARPLNRVIQNEILTPVANLMVDRGVFEGGEISVGKDDDGLDFAVTEKGQQPQPQESIPTAEELKQAEPAGV